MKHYKHLTSQQRYQISGLLKTNISQSEITRMIGVSQSTISRELRRNLGKLSYRPQQAHQFAVNRKAINSKRISEFGWAYIETLLTRKYAPE